MSIGLMLNLGNFKKGFIVSLLAYVNKQSD